MPYCFSWGPIAWVYVSEIFPTRSRAAGVSIAVATQWLFNFVISKVVPYFEVRLPNGKLFFMFGSINFVMATYAFFLPETRGLSLEEMDVIFGAVTAEQRARDLEAKEREDSERIRPVKAGAEDEKAENEHVENVPVNPIRSEV